MLTTFKMLYAPIFFGGFAVAALTLVQMGAGLFWLPVLVVLAIALSLIAESFAPYEPLWNKSLKDRQRDLIHSFVNEGSIVGMVALLPVIVGLVPWPSVWPAGLPLWIEVVAAVTLLDIGITLVHFASHRVDWLWRFHAVHHSVKRMYGFNGLLKHPVHQTMEITGGALPWLLVGVPSIVVAAFKRGHENRTAQIHLGGRSCSPAPSRCICRARRCELWSLLYILGCDAWNRLLFDEQRRARRLNRHRGQARLPA